MQERVINDKKKKKSVEKDSSKILRPVVTHAGPSQEIEDKGRDEVDDEKGEDKDEENEKNNDTAKSEENNNSEKDNVQEAESNTCRNVCKDIISKGRVNIDL